RREITPLAKASAVDAQAARPRGDDSDREGEQQQTGDHGREPCSQAEDQQDPERDLEERLNATDEHGEVEGQQAVRGDGPPAGGPVPDLDRGGDDPYPA